VSSEDGLTLIEMLVVVSIIGILTALAIPSLSEYNDSQRASEDARHVSLMLSELRSEAIRQRSTLTIQLTDSGFEWSLNGQEGSHELSKGSSWASGSEPTLSFNGLGFLTPAGQPLDLVVERDTFQKTVSINRNGFIEISK
jgi:prepilin-type N-terminal cleavage/methylation domain-containing protein